MSRFFLAFLFLINVTLFSAEVHYCPNCRRQLPNYEMMVSHRSNPMHSLYRKNCDKFFKQYPEYLAEEKTICVGPTIDPMSLEEQTRYVQQIQQKKSKPSRLSPDDFDFLACVQPDVPDLDVIPSDEDILLKFKREKESMIKRTVEALDFMRKSTNAAEKKERNDHYLALVRNYNNMCKLEKLMKSAV